MNETPTNYSMVTTADGSLSCLDKTSGELCHNRAGAYTEALKNYVEASNAIESIKKTGKLRVLDACYGMGYNSWVLINEILRRVDFPFSLSITAVETSREIMGFLPLIFENPSFDILKFKTPSFEHNIYYRTQKCLSDTKRGPKFIIQVVEPDVIKLDFRIDDLRRVVPALEGPYDLIFHDPFSPAKMPELWTVDLFKEYARLLKPSDGKLLTYSAAASVRGGLMEAGFSVGKTEALGAKSGGTLASFKSDKDIPLDEQELAYINTRAGIPFRDPGLSSSRDVILQSRAHEQSTSERLSGNSVRQFLRSRP